MAGFYLHLRPHAVGPQNSTSQVELAGCGFLQGLLDVAVPQAFAFTWLPTAVTVLPGLPLGEDELLLAKTQCLILQGCLAQTSVRNVQGAHVLKVNLVLYHLDAFLVNTVVQARLGWQWTSNENAAFRHCFYVQNTIDGAGPVGPVLKEVVPLCPRGVAVQKDIIVGKQGPLALLAMGTADGNIEPQERDHKAEQQPQGGQHGGLGLWQ